LWEKPWSFYNVRHEGAEGGRYGRMTHLQLRKR
jgi:hypothetical protein